MRMSMLNVIDRFLHALRLTADEAKRENSIRCLRRAPCPKTWRKKFHVIVKCRSSNSLEYTVSIMPIVFVLIILLFGLMSSLYSQGGNQNNNDSLDIQSRTSRR